MTSQKLLKRVYITKPELGSIVNLNYPTYGTFLVSKVGNVRQDLGGRDFYEVLLEQNVAAEITQNIEETQAQDPIT